MAPTGQTRAAASLMENAESPSSPAVAIDCEKAVFAPPGYSEHLLVVRLRAGPHTQLTQNAAIVVNDRFRMAGIDLPYGVRMRKPWRQHFFAVGQCL